MKYVIIHYNTPKLTFALISSLRKCGINDKILIFENSDKDLLHAENYFDNITTLDNSKGQLINFENAVNELIVYKKLTRAQIIREKGISNFGSYKHALSVQWFIDHLNEDFVLLDSDILIKEDFRKILIDPTKCFCGMSNGFRVLPFLLYINSNELKKNNIRFCNKKLIHPDYNDWRRTDTGGSFLTECIAKKVAYKNIDIFKYIIHYGSGSWRKNSKDKTMYQNNINLSVSEWLMMNKDLFL